MTNVINDVACNKNASLSLLNASDNESDLENEILNIKSSFQAININDPCLMEEIKSLLLSIDKKIETLLEIQQKNVDILSANGEIQKILKELRWLNFSSFTKIKSKFKKFWQPRLGSLDQYPGRKLKLEKNYNNKITLAKNPTISIVTPSYNQGRFLERTIKSITDQKYPALEYIIQDGLSGDNSVSILKQYDSTLKHWETTKDNGQSHALNLGFRHATGDIMAYLNSDDILLPNSLNYVADFFNKNPNVDVLYSHRILINEEDQEIGRWILPPHCENVLKWADYIPQETLFWRRRIWEKVGSKIDESFKFAMDWDLLLRFEDAGAVFARVPRFLGAFRIHSKQKTSANISDTGNQEMARLRMRYHGRNLSYYEIKKNTFSYLVKHIIFQKLYRVGLLRY